MMKRTPSVPRLLTIADVAECLRVSTKTVRRKIDANELAVHRIGRRLRVTEEDLNLFISGRRR